MAQSVFLDDLQWRQTKQHMPKTAQRLVTALFADRQTVQGVSSEQIDNAIIELLESTLHEGSSFGNLLLYASFHGIDVEDCVTPVEIALKINQSM